jgi:hypothetical protein
VPSHDDAAAEYRFFRVQCGESLAFRGRKNVLNQSGPLLVEIVPDFLPIECVDTGDCSICGMEPVTRLFALVTASTKRAFILVPACRAMPVYVLLPSDSLKERRRF